MDASKESSVNKRTKHKTDSVYFQIRKKLILYLGRFETYL